MLEDQYNLVFDQGQTTSQSGSIIIENESYTIRDFQSTGNISISQDQIWKIQSKVFWGFIDRDLPNVDLEMINEELKILNVGLVPNAPFPQEGYYGYYTVDSDENVIVNNIPSTGMQQFFIMDTPQKWDRLKDILGEMTQKFPSLIYHFTKFDGEVFSNI